MQKTVIISLGGSLIAPENYDIGFLAGFKRTIDKFLRKNYRFVVYCGGGKLARKVQDAASKIARVENSDLDWLGIHATKLNAHLVRTIFKNDAESHILDNPNLKVKFSKKVLVAGGWAPGWSTDYDAVLAAKNLRIREIINMSNVDFVYDKDPSKYSGAKRMEQIKWRKFRKLTGSEWKAGMNVPFDPVAAKEAEKLRLKVNFIGRDLKNLERLLEGKKFKGTIIR